MPEADVPLLAAKNISRRFGSAPVLDSVSLTLAAGTLTVLTGRNGSGKTTLVNCLTGFDLAYEGEVQFRGTPLGRTPADGRARLGLVRTFQYPHVFADLRVGDHVRLGRLAGLAAIRSYFTRWGTAVTAEIVDELDLSPLLERPGFALSFGEMKVVNTARALATGAPVVLLDEPLASLHGWRRALMVRAIERRRSAGYAVLVIEHEAPELAASADDLFELEGGTLNRRSPA